MSSIAFRIKVKFNQYWKNDDSIIILAQDAS